MQETIVSLLFRKHYHDHGFLSIPPRRVRSRARISSLQKGAKKEVAYLCARYRIGGSWCKVGLEADARLASILMSRRTGYLFDAFSLDRHTPSLETFQNLVEILWKVGVVRCS
jgi:hypothetical protein